MEGNKMGRIRDLQSISPPQMELFNILIQIFPDAELEYRIGGRKNKKGFNVRWADIGIPSLKLDFEYDGWGHKIITFEDKKRDEELLLQGWKTIRINKEKLSIIKLNIKNIRNKKEFLYFLDRVDKVDRGFHFVL